MSDGGTDASDAGHGPLDEGFLSFVQPKSELMAEVSVGFDGFRQAQRDLVGHLPHGVEARRKKFLQAERLDERLAFTTSEPTPTATDDGPNHRPRGARGPIVRHHPPVSYDRAGHARNHGVRIPIHVLGPSIRLGVPRIGSFRQSDGFDEVVALMHGLSVRTVASPLSKAMLNHHRSVLVRGDRTLGEPIG